MWALYQPKVWWDPRACKIDARMKWNEWGDLDRAEAVVHLRRWGLSFRVIAEIAGCSEGLIRNFELLGIAHPRDKQKLYERRITTRQLERLSRRQHKKQRQQQQ